MKLGIIVGTTRQSRQTAKVAKWVADTAAQTEGVEVSVIDLADYPMPFFEEPVSPRYNPEYKPNETAQQFLQQLAVQDAYVVVTPEYNHNIPGVLKNALDYVAFELKRKPAAVVSHSVVPVGGARAGVVLKEVLSELFAVPIQNTVTLQSGLLNDEGQLDEATRANAYGPQGGLQGLLDELRWYSDALSAARQQ